MSGHQGDCRCKECLTEDQALGAVAEPGLDEAKGEEEEHEEQEQGKGNGPGDRMAQGREGSSEDKGFGREAIVINVMRY